MDVRFSIALPREAYTVPVMRQFMGEALRINGVCAECRSDILVAATEACANVVDHGDPAPSYAVVATVGPDSCVLEIANTGPEFDASAVPLPALEAESGRGILLMRAFVDRVSFGSVPGGGTVVRLSKDLHPRPGREDTPHRPFAAVG
ncbi:ATP-binding protein [Marinactinospora thermotolerans]|uniref:Serine/threonine-protein kinase RsbW n=1 Tax=Marinactinospora thermotolerans DSM 45154 TaxID=1122192 RepID=A0A1T4NAD1_9ACTN|nr:ATP-binding protein [Marinactinospora thermotolerans]SJZ76202.1 serine/threonine-protein kinase RsbW [Marinactinospora thermotolerans DSM 45154]